MCTYENHIGTYEYPHILYLCDMYEEDWSIACVAEAFEHDPIGFEHLCAEILQEMGAYVHITPAVKDGGYDLDIWFQHQRYLGECKCFAPEHKVGRPYLQKLVGANAVEHADKLIFLTTSAFTEDAKAYARQVHMQLVDGELFAYLMKSHWHM